jgi:nitrite reductase/ring-hydroxylating ferredoxin subunit
MYERELALRWWMRPFGIDNFWRIAGGVDMTFDNFDRLLARGELGRLQVTELTGSLARLPAALEGLRIALFNVDGRYYAIDDTCPHAGGSLSEGDLDDTTVECPLHSARFDLTTGQMLSPPADTDVVAYQVRVAGNDIMLEFA